MGLREDAGLSGNNFVQWTTQLCFFLHCLGKLFFTHMTTVACQFVRCQV
jgi:hypothetical protein